MNKIIIFIISVLTLIFGGIDKGSCTPITFEFKGAVTYYGEHGIAPGTDGSISLGTPIVGRFTFDSNAQNLFPTLNDEASYPIDFMIVNIGNYTLTSTCRIVIWNDRFDNDLYEVISSGSSIFTNNIDTFNDTSSIGRVQFYDIPMYDHDKTVFPSLNLPQTPPDLAEFETLFFTIVFGQDMFNYTNITASIETLSTATIPEPATILLLCTGLFGTVVLRIKKISCQSTS